jgi:hypothetical protein
VIPNPPPELKTAILNANQTYGIPDTILEGIWQIEAGGAFPNNFENDLGYGGLFGTKNWNGTTQSQADTAAQILAQLFAKYGNWTDAIYHYSGGAYNSVPGENIGESVVRLDPADPVVQKLQDIHNTFNPGAVATGNVGIANQTWALWFVNQFSDVVKKLEEILATGGTVDLSTVLSDLTTMQADITAIKDRVLKDLAP